MTLLCLPPYSQKTDYDVWLAAHQTQNQSLIIAASALDDVMNENLCSYPSLYPYLIIWESHSTDTTYIPHSTALVYFCPPTSLHIRWVFLRLRWSMIGISSSNIIEHWYFAISWRVCKIGDWHEKSGIWFCNNTYCCCCFLLTFLLFWWWGSSSCRSPWRKMYWPCLRLE